MATLYWSHFGHGAVQAQLMLLCLEEGPMQARELLNELERSYDLYLEPGMLLGVLSQLEAARLDQGERR